MKRASFLPTLGLVALGAVAVGACNAILDVPSPTLAENVTCAGGKCVCKAGFADCDGDEGTGCEADLAKPSHCGECGHDCHHGSCAAGKCACEERFAHCTSKQGDDCETDLESDGKHCGACGHDCLGGACKAGVCQPLLFASVVGAQNLVLTGGTVLVGVCSAAQPDAGVPDGGLVATSFYEVSLDDGKATPRVVTPVCGGIPVLTSTSLVWAGTDGGVSGSIVETPLPLASGATESEPTPTKTLVGDTIAVGLALTEKNVYWRELGFTPPSTFTDTGLWLQGRAGGSRVHVATESAAVAAQGTTVYWTSAMTAAVYQRDEATAVNVKISSLQGINITSDDGHLYFWVPEDGIYSMPIPIPNPEVPPNATLIVPGVKSMGTMLSDGKFLYWIENTTSDAKAFPLTGGPVRTLVEKVGFGSVASLAADDEALYFIGDSVIGRVAR